METEEAPVVTEGTSLYDIDDLPCRVSNALATRDIDRVRDLLRLTREDLLEMKGIGERGVAEVEIFLQEHGFKLKTNFDDLQKRRAKYERLVKKHERHAAYFRAQLSELDAKFADWLAFPERAQEAPEESIDPIEE